MQPHYSFSSPCYTCNTRKKRYGEPICQSLTIAHVDQAVSDAFLAVIRPATIEAVLALGEEFDREQAQIERQWQLRLEQTGCTPLQWVDRARLRGAQYLLETTGHPVERIASLVGFGSATTFRGGGEQPKTARADSQYQ
jgi:transcriptional regulator GlxA family with amidase domain